MPLMGVPAPTDATIHRSLGLGAAGENSSQCELSNTSLPIHGAILPGVEGSAVHLGNVG